MSTADRVIQLCAMMGEGEHKMVVLTSGGQMFERIRDPKAFANRPGFTAGYIWKLIPGPLDPEVT
jgi:hypothetical protein